MEFVTLTNDDAVPSAVVTQKSADVMLDTDGRDCSFKGSKYFSQPYMYSFYKVATAGG